MPNKGFFKRFVVALADTYRDPAPIEQAIEKSNQPASFNALPTIFGGMSNVSGSRKYGTGVSFETLRNFSVMYDVGRACINHRKRQISNLDWNIVATDPEKDVSADPRVARLIEFFQEPFHETSFRNLTDKMLDDMLVYDGIVLWKNRTRGGEMLGLLNVDASTIRIKVEEDGTLPQPPETAYVQFINGEVYERYTTKEMYYKIFNPRTATPYGLSPLESLIIGVDAALRSQMYNLSVLTEGSVPEGFYKLPPEMTVEAIKEFQTWFDLLMAGNPKMQNRIKFMPGGQGSGFEPTKKPSDMQFMELEKWLMKKTCAMFDVQPRDIGFTDDVANVTDKGQHEVGMQRGLIPTALFFKEFFDEIIRKDFGIKDLQFQWDGLQAVDEDFELRKQESEVKSGIVTIDEIRMEQGKKPFGLEATSKPIMITGTGPVLLDTVTTESVEEGRRVAAASLNNNPDPKEEEEDDEVEEETKAAISEMRKWRKKSISAFGKSGKLPKFKTEYINSAVEKLIEGRLAIAKSHDDIRLAFDPFIDALEKDMVISKAVSLDAEVAKIKRNYGSAGSHTTGR